MHTKISQCSRAGKTRNRSRITFWWWNYAFATKSSAVIVWQKRVWCAAYYASVRRNGTRPSARAKIDTFISTQQLWRWYFDVSAQVTVATRTVWARSKTPPLQTVKRQHRKNRRRQSWNAPSFNQPNFPNVSPPGPPYLCTWASYIVQPWRD